MRIFISWAGDRSKAVAEAFREWLPKVLQAVKLFMSNSDIDKGAKWDAQISTQLAETQFGLIFLTPENRLSPAIHYEAGALSKFVEQSRLWTYLYDLNHTDIKWPLSEFQHTKAEKEDTYKLLQSMNAALGHSRLTDGDLNEIFDTWWPKLEARLQAIPTSSATTLLRSERDILEEILERVRTTRDNLILSWVTDRVDGPRAVSYISEEDGRVISVEEATTTYQAWNRFAFDPYKGSMIFSNSKIGEAHYLPDKRKVVKEDNSFDDPPASGGSS